jgi:Kef-type K+ transport system membrane component KefB
VEVAEILLDILIVLVAAKIAAELAERVGFPPVVAEILAGVVIGPSVLDLVETEETLLVLGEIGVILLLLQVGMEMDLGELGAVGRASISVALVGVAVPMALGFGTSELLGYEPKVSLFLGAALAATSVGITARVFSDLRALASVEARTVLGAAVADDVLGLVILTVVVRIVSEGSVSILSVLGIIGVAVLFLVGTTIVGLRVAPPLFHFLHAKARSAGTLVAIALSFTLLFAELAHAAQLAPIVGAFVAGLALSRSSTAGRIERELAPVGHLFIPVFFLTIGMDVEVGQFFDLHVLGIASALLVVAVIGKLVAAVGAVGSPGDKAVIGFGMLPRGEVGLIFATIGLQEGVLGEDLYAALLLVVLATTLAAPPLLRWRLQRIQSDRPSRPVEPRPPEGWLRVHDHVVELAATPPQPVALEIGIEAARLLADHERPGPALLEYLGSLGETPLRWSERATRELFDVLRLGNARSWRFLEVTGVLERALPELAEAVRRRHDDPFLLDVTSALRFSLVESIRDVVETDERARREHAQLAHPEWLLLAALILDTAGEDSAPVELARRLVKRLDLGANAEQEVALLAGDSGLLRAAIRRLDALDEERVFALATHLDRPERARALYLLSLAGGELDAVERTRLDELLDRVLAVLEHPELTGLDARNLIERKRTEALRLLGEMASSGARERVEHAPRAYLLAQAPDDLARQASLLEPIPPRGRVRVTALPIPSANGTLPAARWRYEVAGRDRFGLLAHVTGALAGFGLGVDNAVIATWPDGGALESFDVRAERDDLPETWMLEQAIADSFERDLSSDPTPGAFVTFDSHASPWYTICEVRSPDLPGLLHAVTVALADAGVDVHSARVTTVEGEAVDTFELTDRNGRKLDTDRQSAVARAIHDGVQGPRRGRFALRRRA